MTSRCFAFGCSYTHYVYATWADYFGSNFDEYYNYAQPGASNTFIMNKFVEANEKYSFNSDSDYVLIMLTGFGRFSYIDENIKWVNKGDLYSYYEGTKDEKIGWLLKNIWNDHHAVYMSWVASKLIKNILQSKNIPHKILMGIDNTAYLKDNGYNYGYAHNLNKDGINLANEIYDLVDNTQSYDEWMRNIDCENKHPIWKDENNRVDGHPSQSLHYRYFKEHFPEFVTNKSHQLFESVERIYEGSTQYLQANNFINNFYKSYNKQYESPLFGRT